MPIALIHPGALGDLILALPLAQTLARAGDRVELFAVGSRGRLLAGRSAVAAAHSIEHPSLARLFLPNPTTRPDGAIGHGSRAEARALAGFDRIVTAIADAAFLANLTAAAPGARIDPLRARPGEIEQSGRHASEFLHGQLFPDQPTPLPHVQPREDERPTDPADVLIHPGSGGRAKCWPVDGFVELADRLRSAGRRVRFVLGEAERERFTPADRAAMDGFETLTALSLEALAGQLSAASAYVGNDSGVTHLAAAVGTATWAIFGPTRTAVWQPRGRRVKVLAGDVQTDRRWGLSPSRLAAEVLA